MNSVPDAEMRPPRLDRAPAKPANALIRGAKVIDPRAGVDGNHDLLIGETDPRSQFHHVIDIDDIDAFPDTPVLDIKP